MTSAPLRIVAAAGLLTLTVGCTAQAERASSVESPTTATAAEASTTATTAEASTTTTTTAEASTTTPAPQETGSIDLGPPDRRARLVAPDDVTASSPLVVLLHGYTSSATAQDAYLGVTEQAASRGLYVLLPEGTSGDDGKSFWDAAPACCNFTGTPVDDVGYLRSLIAEAIEERPIDPARVYVFGHSNGGFMAYRLACELADEVTAVAVLAGSEREDAQDCQPSRAVSVLHLHGDADGLITYSGGRTVVPFPGAVEVVSRWAARAGCDADPIEGGRLDLDTGILGEDTVVSAYEGCADGVDVQLDTIEGGSHIPALDHAKVGTDVLDWLLAHSR